MFSSCSCLARASTGACGVASDEGATAPTEAASRGENAPFGEMPPPPPAAEAAVAALLDRVAAAGAAAAEAAAAEAAAAPDDDVLLRSGASTDLWMMAKSELTTSVKEEQKEKQPSAR